MLDHFSIRSMTEGDLPMVLTWRNHPEVRRFMLTQHEINLTEHTDWFNRAVQDSKRRLLIVQDRDNPIGYVQFSGVTPAQIAHWGFYANPDAIKGTGRKIGILALDFAFFQLKLKKVCGQAIATNHASIRFHERLGFKREIELPDRKRIMAEYQSLISFGLLADEWKLHIKENLR